ncbi:hypothetical protein [uncultured Sphingomonas sp.]|uniref:hypothetical protein n=1 Tax=uncultured Sphingomonas sp. TaxID=158754 RepID=UPI00374A2983
MAKKGKIPKKIAGVKLSKAVRKPAEKLIAKAQTPEGRRVLAAGLAMAASVLATRSTPKPADTPPPVPPVPPVPPAAPEAPVPPVPPKAPTPPPDGMGAHMVDPGAIADAVGKAASAFIDGFFNKRR